MIHEAGGPELFFERFRGLDYEAYEQPAFRALLEPWLKAALSADIAILQVSFKKLSTIFGLLLDQACS